MNRHESIQGLVYRWYVLQIDEPCAALLMQKTNLPLPLTRILVARGYTTVSSVQQFIAGDITDVVDASALAGGGLFVDRIIRAIQAKEKILIAGDYDVDGITGTSLLLLCLRELGACVNFFLPNRVRDGYGLSVNTVERAAAAGYSVIITVDNGTTAYAAVDRARELGVDVLITDHHQPELTRMPNAYCIVNPHQIGCNYPFKQFAGVGVAFKCMQLLFDRLNKTLPDGLYEFLLMGTVADLVPLIGENRYWVQYGLQKLNAAPSLAIKMMIEDTALQGKSTIRARDIGFMVAPQLNALGRLDDPRAGVSFLLGNTQANMRIIAQKLKALNNRRKEIERDIFEQAIALLKEENFDHMHTPLAFVVAPQQWPIGVIGLVAGKLSQRFGVPAVVVTESSSGVLKGSCRSPFYCNIIEALQSVKSHLISVGGHTGAAGISLRKENLTEFRQAIVQAIRDQIKEHPVGPSLLCEGRLWLSDINSSLGNGLEQLEPFGAGNPEPIFFVPHIQVYEEPQLIKEQHVKVRCIQDGVIKQIIFFKKPELYDWFLHRVGSVISVVGQITVNEWQGKKTYDLIGLDVA